MLLFVIAILSLIPAGAALAAGAHWLWAIAAFFGGMLALFLAVFLFLLYLCSRVDQSVPQEEDDRFYRVFTNLILESVLPILRIRIKATGLEKMPQDGRFLLVCNHTNDSDPIILMRVFAKQQLAFVSKKENSTMFVIGPMMHKLQCQLINRENDREALKTILRCIQILKEDKASVAIFPEGGINDDKLLHPFKPGVFKIAQKANVPIVVCSLHNTKYVVSNLLKGRGTRVEMHLLEVIPAEEVKATNTVDMAHRCHDLIAADLGPDLVASN